MDQMSYRDAFWPAWVQIPSEIKVERLCDIFVFMLERHVMETLAAEGLEMFVNILGKGHAHFLVKKRVIISVGHVDE